MGTQWMILNALGNTKQDMPASGYFGFQQHKGSFQVNLAGQGLFDSAETTAIVYSLAVHLMYTDMLDKARHLLSKVEPALHTLQAFIGANSLKINWIDVISLLYLRLRCIASIQPFARPKQKQTAVFSRSSKWGGSKRTNGSGRRNCAASPTRRRGSRTSFADRKARPAEAKRRSSSATRAGSSSKLARSNFSSHSAGSSSPYKARGCPCHAGSSTPRQAILSTTLTEIPSITISQTYESRIARGMVKTSSKPRTLAGKGFDLSGAAGK